MTTRPVILTVAQFSERNPAWTQAALRKIIFNANQSSDRLGGAIIRLGRRVLLDESKFLAWVARDGRAK